MIDRMVSNGIVPGSLAHTNVPGISLWSKPGGGLGSIVATLRMRDIVVVVATREHHVLVMHSVGRLGWVRAFYMDRVAR